ncbi:MAG: 6,7-dimethyl-8-ribityllumazine synthase [Bacteroidetes bacterium]|nr:6,7-dimethyl-8-ribityllumazine synthase [Bacteroidota bacterium]
MSIYTPLNANDKVALPHVSAIKIGIVTAEWNRHITGVLLEGAKEVLLSQGIIAENIICNDVPGSFELPLAAQWLAHKEEIDAVICLGCVIKGDTPHFDFVCQAATNGILEVGLKYNKPVIFGVITTNNEQQALDRAGGSLGNKGSEAAITALKMLAIKR